MSLRINKRKNPYPQKNAGIKRKAVNFKASLPAVVKRILSSQMETKEVSAYQVTIPIPASGLTSILNNIAEGLDINNRVGRTVCSKNILIDYYITPPTTASLIDSGFAALVYDSQSNSTAATFGNIFDISVAPPGLSFKNTLSGTDKRFRVCWIEHYSVQSGGNSFKVRKFWKCQDGKVEFNTSASAIAITGAYYLLFGSTNNTGSGLSSASITYNAKYQYTDA